ncbi:MAG: MBL fold metallo-hydrolase RNA specificity domain-containing protein [Candidatus Paceibacterota bacterium]
MIPAFSLEKTQELLFEIRRMMEESRIPLIKVFLDSPLAIGVTRIYKKYISYFNEAAQKSYAADPDDGLFSFPQLIPTFSTKESIDINDASSPKIIIAGAGMSNGGRIVHHERRYLPGPRNTLLVTGYQAPYTLGRKLQDGAKTVKIMGEDVSVQAKIVTISGYSSHKGSDDLFDFVGRVADSVKKVFVALGEPKSSLYMVQRIRDNLAVDASSPLAGETINLDM